MFTQVIRRYPTALRLAVSAPFALCWGPAAADVAIDAAIYSTVTTNLLQDSSEQSDWIRAVALNARIYPTATTEFRVLAMGQSYAQFSRANHLHGALGATQILHQEADGARFLVETRVDLRRFADDSRELDEWRVSGGLTWTSNAIRTPSYRAGIRGHTNQYPNASYADSWQVEAFGGFNISLPGRHSLDLEAGAALIGLMAFGAPFGFVDPRIDRADYLYDTGMTTVYCSPRWSHSIGEWTGLSLQYTVRWPVRGRRLVVYGFSSGYLSPWADAYYGNEFEIRMRTLSVRSLTADLRATYAVTQYLFNINDLYGSRLHYENRWDHVSAVTLGATRPFRLGGTRLTVSSSLKYTLNRSSMAQYDFSEILFAAGVAWDP